MKKQQECTLWTSPMSEWTRVLEGAELTEEVAGEIRRAASSFDEAKAKERLKAFDTVINQETLAKAVF